MGVVHGRLLVAAVRTVSDVYQYFSVLFLHLFRVQHIDHLFGSAFGSCKSNDCGFEPAEWIPCNDPRLDVAYTCQQAEEFDRLRQTDSKWEVLRCAASMDSIPRTVSRTLGFVRC